MPTRTTITLCCALLALFLGGAAGARTHSARFTIEQVLSAPFPSGMVAAPAGGHVAWVSNDRGARNVWVGGGGAAARALTAYAGDDGADLGDLAWDASGTRLFYTRGGSIEGGPPVNTLSLPSGPPAQSVFTVGLDGGPPRLVGAGHLPSVSRAGGHVAFLSGGQIWWAPVAAGDAAPLVHDRGEDGDLAWSPDGTRLAFVSTRSGRGMVGVLDVAARKIAWMAPSVDSDMAPAWSPDGRLLAFVRVPAGETGVDFRAHATGQPWSILVCDPAEGAGRAVWTAQPGAGSVFAPLVGSPALRWVAGRIVFAWERTGWLHLYDVPAEGGAPAREVTPAGAYEVFNTALGADGTLAYSANAGDIERWHVWTVPPGGGAARPLTNGHGIEDYPVLASDGALFAMHAEARRPLQPVAVAADGRMTELAPGTVPADFPQDRLVEPRTVTFQSPDGLTVHGQLFLPREGQVGRGPAMLFFHGGPVRQMLPAWHPMDAYSFMYGFNQYLADEGYVVLSVNYRGGIGYGLGFREPEGFGAGGASELQDIVGAARYLGARADVDPARIGIWGGSYGGLMTALGLARAPDLLAAGVDYAGVHDWRAILPQLSAPGAPAGAADLAFRSSAMASLKSWRAPVLVVHADDDRNVPFDQSVELVEGLRKQGLAPDELVLPDELHVLLRHESWVRFFEAADGFLNRALKEK